MGAASTKICRKTSHFEEEDRIFTMHPRKLRSFHFNAINFVTEFVIAADSRLILSGGQCLTTCSKNFIYLFSTSTFKCLKKIQVEELMPEKSRICFLPHINRNIISINGTDNLKLWNILHGTSPMTISCPDILSYCYMKDSNRLALIKNNIPGIEVVTLHSLDREPESQEILSDSDYNFSTIDYISRFKCIMASNVHKRDIFLIDAETLTIRHRVDAHQFITEQEKNLHSFYVTRCREEFLFAKACYEPDKGVTTEGFFYPVKVYREILLVMYSIDKWKRVQTIDQTAKNHHVNYCFGPNVLIESSQPFTTFMRPGIEKSRVSVEIQSSNEVYIEDQHILLCLSREKHKFHVVDLFR